MNCFRISTISHSLIHYPYSYNDDPDMPSTLKMTARDRFSGLKWIDGSMEECRTEENLLCCNVFQDKRWESQMPDSWQRIVNFLQRKNRFSLFCLGEHHLPNPSKETTELVIKQKTQLVYIYINFFFDASDVVSMYLGWFGGF